MKLLNETGKSGRGSYLYFCRCSSGKVPKGSNCMHTAWEQFQASRGTFNRSLLIAFSMNHPNIFLGVFETVDEMTVIAWGLHPYASLTTIFLCWIGYNLSIEFISYVYYLYPTL